MTAIPPQPPLQPAPGMSGFRRPRLALAVVICLCLVLVLFVGGLAGVAFYVHHRFSRDITYQVSGTARAVTIVYEVKDEPPGSGGRTTLREVAPPWSAGFHTNWMTASARVEVVRDSTSAETMSCTISVDGQVVAHETSTEHDLAIVCLEPER